MEIQKLNSQKDYFIRSVGEMEKKLTDTIESADTTEKDARYRQHTSTTKYVLLPSTTASLTYLKVHPQLEFSLVSFQEKPNPPSIH